LWSPSAGNSRNTGVSSGGASRPSTLSHPTEEWDGVSGTPSATIAVPTRRRPDYLGVTLASVAPQAQLVGAEVLVISDGIDPPTQSVARQYGVRVISLPVPAGLNAARNRAVREAAAELIAFIDDDVRVRPGWLEALLEGARRAPDHDVFGGPILARLEGGGPRACGRESAPITTLDLGSEDRDVPLVWGAIMAIRRRAFELAGPFDEALCGRGDEEEWEQRYTAAGGRIRYLAGAGLEHRRAAADATVRALSRAAYRLGRSARRNDLRKGTAPPIRAELRTLAGCLWHAPRHRCSVGLVLAAHTAGRVREAIAEGRR
jgi:GT2 family glycosyltransferase